MYLSMAYTGYCIRACVRVIYFHCMHGSQTGSGKALADLRRQLLETGAPGLISLALSAPHKDSSKAALAKALQAIGN